MKAVFEKPWQAALGGGEQQEAAGCGAGGGFASELEKLAGEEGNAAARRPASALALLFGAAAALPIAAGDMGAETAQPGLAGAEAGQPGLAGASALVPDPAALRAALASAAHAFGNGASCAPALASAAAPDAARPARLTLGTATCAAEKIGADANADQLPLKAAGSDEANDALALALAQAAACAPMPAPSSGLPVAASAGAVPSGPDAPQASQAQLEHFAASAAARVADDPLAYLPVPVRIENLCVEPPKTASDAAAPTAAAGAAQPAGSASAALRTPAELPLSQLDLEPEPDHGVAAPPVAPPALAGSGAGGRPASETSPLRAPPGDAAPPSSPLSATAGAGRPTTPSREQTQEPTALGATKQTDGASVTASAQTPSALAPRSDPSNPPTSAATSLPEAAKPALLCGSGSAPATPAVTQAPPAARVESSSSAAAAPSLAASPQGAQPALAATIEPRAPRPFAAPARAPLPVSADAEPTQPTGMAFGMRSVDAAVATVIESARVLNAHGKGQQTGGAQDAMAGRPTMEFTSAPAPASGTSSAVQSPLVELAKDSSAADTANEPKREASEPAAPGVELAQHAGAMAQHNGGGTNQGAGQGEQPPSPPEAPLPLPSDVQDAADAIWLRGQGPKAAAVSLQHPELGTMNLVVQQDGGRVEVRAVLETPKAAVILRAQESAMKYGLQQAGLTLGSLRVRTREETETPRAKELAKKRRNEGWEA